mmetsp:Transcript_5532/g.14125  ORF Transcript_5532/g.14125 Transcript_5532/m.14125 type:complete len:332 (-) Transcript_5532:90-1085(-)
MARVEGSSCVQYRFKSSNEFDTLWFDGEGISLNDLKARILDQKNMVATNNKGGKTNEFDLAISNAQTGEEYTDWHVLVPRNTALVIKRVPLHRRLTLTSKRGTVELGLHGDGGDDGTEDARGLGAPAEALLATDDSGAPAAAPKSLTELQPDVALLFYCPLCGQLLRAASIVSCCAVTFCEECARTQLERTGACPSCGVPSNSVELVPNVQMQKVVGRHAELHPALAQGADALLGGLDNSRISLEDGAEAAMRSMMMMQQMQALQEEHAGGRAELDGDSSQLHSVQIPGANPFAWQHEQTALMQQQWAAMMAMQQASMMPGAGYQQPPGRG